MGWLYEEQRRDEEKRDRKHRDEIATLTEANAKLTAEVERLEGDKKRLEAGNRYAINILENEFATYARVKRDAVVRIKEIVKAMER
jgi:hypothetical protein